MLSRIEKDLTDLGRNVAGFRMIAAFGDEEQALIMYDLLTGPYGVLMCAKHLIVRGGKIERDKLTFDSYLIRKTHSPTTARKAAKTPA